MTDVDDSSQLQIGALFREGEWDGEEDEEGDYVALREGGFFFSGNAMDFCFSFFFFFCSSVCIKVSFYLHNQHVT